MGVELARRVTAIDHQHINFKPDLAANVAAAQMRMHRVLNEIDSHIEDSGLASEVLDPEPTQSLTVTEHRHRLDLRDRGITSVIWATGHRRTIRLRIPVSTSTARSPRSRRHPGARSHVLGQRFQHHRAQLHRWRGAMWVHRRSPRLPTSGAAVPSVSGDTFIERPRYDVVVVGATRAATAMLLARRGDRLGRDQGRYGADTLSTRASAAASCSSPVGSARSIIDAGTPPIRRTTFHYAHDNVGSDQGGAASIRPRRAARVDQCLALRGRRRTCGTASRFSTSADGNDRVVGIQGHDERRVSPSTPQGDRRGWVCDPSSPTS